MRESIWPDSFGGVVVTGHTQYTTASAGKTGRHIDYFIVHKDLAGLELRGRTAFDVPVRTHLGVALSFPRRPASFEQTVIVKPSRWEPDPPFGPQPPPDLEKWAEVRAGTQALLRDMEAGTVTLEEAPEKLDLAYSAYAAAAECELIGTHGLADSKLDYKGRGGNQDKEGQGRQRLQKFPPGLPSCRSGRKDFADDPRQSKHAYAGHALMA